MEGELSSIDFAFVELTQSLYAIELLAEHLTVVTSCGLVIGWSLVSRIKTLSNQVTILTYDVHQSLPGQGVVETARTYDFIGVHPYLARDLTAQDVVQFFQCGALASADIVCLVLWECPMGCLLGCPCLLAHLQVVDDLVSEISVSRGRYVLWILKHVSDVEVLDGWLEGILVW